MIKDCWRYFVRWVLGYREVRTDRTFPAFVTVAEHDAPAAPPAIPMTTLQRMKQRDAQSQWERDWQGNT